MNDAQTDLSGQQKCSLCDQEAIMELAILNERNEQVGVLSRRCLDHAPVIGG